MGTWYVSFKPNEAAHIFRDLKSVSADHGKRNVSRETHDMIMQKLQLFLEVSYRGTQSQSQSQLSLFQLPPEDGVG